MTCKIKCSGFKVLNTGGSLTAPAVVRSLTTSGSKLQVTNTDGTSYELDLPKADPANVQLVNILNASGTQTVAAVTTLN